MFEDEVDHLNQNWTYKYDIDQYARKESWQILKEAPYVGDCEDYSLTLLFNICEGSYLKFWWSLITRKAKMNYVTVPTAFEGGHAVLRYNNMYIDNNQRTWCTKQTLLLKGYDFKKSWWLWGASGVAAKLLAGKIKWRSK
jgi:hypothetical protein